MNKLTKKWVKALRSGGYKQARENLYTGTGNSRSYCCLGVACSLLSKETNKKFSHFNNGQGELNKNGLELLGISTGLQDKLMNMNDWQGKTFKQIADYIEKKVK